MGSVQADASSVAGAAVHGPESRKATYQNAGTQAMKTAKAAHRMLMTLTPRTRKARASKIANPPVYTSAKSR
jgi:hypothetical protein